MDNSAIISQLQAICAEEIGNNEQVLAENKWLRRYAEITLDGNAYLCQLSINRKGKREKQRQIQS